MRACEFINEDFSGSRKTLSLPKKNLPNSPIIQQQQSTVPSATPIKSIETPREVTPRDLNKIEDVANKEWNPDGIGVNIHTTNRRDPRGTSHIVQQVNLPRNKPPIEPEEIKDLFVDAHKFPRSRKEIASLRQGDEAVLKGSPSNINIPVVVGSPRKNYASKVDLELTPKTIMRTPNYQTRSPTILVPKLR